MVITTASADSDIQWDWIPAVEVSVIEDADFVYIYPNECIGITWNGPADWTVEVITGGDYFVEYEVAMVDWTDPIKCERLAD
tara:strand:+ start:260 stop:505 length:246 start_codon:yes stop_codon:yes gene_type:complete